LDLTLPAGFVCSYFASVLVRGLWRRLALGVVDDDSVFVIETPLDMV